MQGNNLLEQYEQFNYIVEQMLINAQSEDWDLLTTWQEKYQQLSENLMKTGMLEKTEIFPAQHQDMIAMYIKNILSYQQQLIQLLSARHRQLGTLIGTNISHQTKIANYQQIAQLI
jgi:hypothetical protein